jgi:amino acid adenylation domain-containing protein
MTTHFTLPTAWQDDHVETAVVPYGDLTGLSALGELPVVLAAAHLKVLSMISEDRTFRADVDVQGQVRTVNVEACATWRVLVGLVLGAQPSEGQPGALKVQDRNGELVLSAAIDRDSMELLASMYRCVLTAMAGGPDGDALAAYLPEDERRRLLTRWSVGPATDRPKSTVVDLFQEQARRTPDSPAVKVDGTVLTYRELDERSNQIARRLLTTRAGALVGVCLRRTADLLPTLLGVWKSGAAYLPLDADLPVQRLRRMVAAAGCDLIVTVTEHRPIFEEDGSFLLLDKERQAIAALPRMFVRLPIGPTHPAYVIYTSGSTGNPKGVLVHHGGLTNYLLWTAEAYAANGTGGSAFCTSIGFDLGMPSLFTPLLTGQAVDLLPDPLDPADLGELLTKGSPYSFLKMTPGHLNMLSLDLDHEQARDLAGLVIAAGDAFPVALAKRWRDLGGAAVATEYGPTEITVGNSGQLVTDLDSDGLVPLGVPIPNTTMYVLTDRLEPVPTGVAGEVYIGGAGVAHGYLGDPALTADRFLPDPYGPPGARLYRTGDRARWRSTGQLEFLGRADDQVKIRGYRVEPAEVRETLRRQADVGDALVVVIEQPRKQPRLAAFVIPTAGRELDVRGLRRQLSTDLPAHMVPAEIVLVEDLPLTANGKVDTRGLRSLL